MASKAGMDITASPIQLVARTRMREGLTSPLWYRTLYLIPMDAAQLQQLDSEGFCLLPGFMSPAFLDALRTRVEELFDSEGSNAGSEFKQEPGARRLANLVDKGEVFERAIVMEQVLEGVARVLGPDYKLSSLNVRVAD